MTWTVEANSRDEAADMFMGMDELKQHLMEKHPDMTDKSPEEMKEGVKGMITPTE